MFKWKVVCLCLQHCQNLFYPFNNHLSLIQIPRTKPIVASPTTSLFRESVPETPFLNQSFFHFLRKPSSLLNHLFLTNSFSIISTPSNRISIVSFLNMYTFLSPFLFFLIEKTFIRFFIVINIFYGFYLINRRRK